jgi:hypothetical protein
MAFNDTISQLTGNSSFYDWFNKENNEIIPKLNQITVSGVTSGDGILASTNLTSGLVTLSFGGTSGTIAAGVTFAGNINFLGGVALPNSSFRVAGITTNTSGYTFGTVVRINSSGYTAARADTPDSAEMIGVISQKTDNYSLITVQGKIDGDFTEVAGSTLFAGCVYFLSPTVAGNITTTEPSTIGQVSKPVLIGLGATSGIVVQYRGNYLYSSEFGPGISGSNVVNFVLPTSPTDPRSYGFSAGMFISFAPNVLSGSTFFNGYLTATGRTAISGWFLTGNHHLMAKLYINDPSWDKYSLIPYEEDFCVGMVSNITEDGGNLTYEVITKGFSSVIPKSVSTRGATASGFWAFNAPSRAPDGTPTDRVTYDTVLGRDQLEIFKHYTNTIVGEGNADPTYLAGAAFENNPTKFFVNVRPNITPWFSTTNALRRTSDSTDIIQNNTNYAFNGDFEIWSRNTGKFAKYTTNDNTYFADNWIRRISTSGTINSFIERKDFTFGSTDVEGSPNYYVDVKHLAATGGANPNGTFSVGHVFEGVDTFNSSPITISFYLKSTHSGYPLDVYISKYGNGSLISKTVIDSLTTTTTWEKYTFNYDDHVGTAPSGYSNDYIEIGIDMNDMVVDAYEALVGSTTNVSIQLASLCVYEGTYASPVHRFDSYQEKLKKCQKFYFSTYKDSQTIGSKTMLNMVDPELNTHTFQYLPGAPYSIFKLPVNMRTTPTVSIYSPSGTISLPEMYNSTANRDLKNTSRTIGYANASRIANLGEPTISSSADESTIKINILGGAVPYDVINCHIVADSSLPI